jgi:serine protease Do
MLALLFSLFLSYPARAMTYTQSNSVMILNPARNSGGSGFYVVTELGNSYILTNAHVCGPRDKYKIIIPQEGPEFKADILFQDKHYDLCALRSIQPHKGFRLAKHLPFCGEYVIFMGYPELEPFKVQVTEHCDEVLLAVVKHGNSGSPVLNLDLEVVGVVDAQFKDSEYGLMIYLKLIQEFLKGK